VRRPPFQTISRLRSRGRAGELDSGGRAENSSAFDLNSWIQCKPRATGQIRVSTARGCAYESRNSNEFFPVPVSPVHEHGQIAAAHQTQSGETPCWDRGRPANNFEFFGLSRRRGRWGVRLAPPQTSVRCLQTRWARPRQKGLIRLLRSPPFLTALTGRL